MASDIDSKVAYHEEMEHLANSAGDFTKAEHHRKMQEIYEALRQKLESGSTQSPNVGQKA